jgi:hypothetical protein
VSAVHGILPLLSESAPAASRALSCDQRSSTVIGLEAFDSVGVSPGTLADVAHFYWRDPLRGTAEQFATSQSRLRASKALVADEATTVSPSLEISAGPAYSAETIVCMDRPVSINRIGKGSRRVDRSGRWVFSVC